MELTIEVMKKNQTIFLDEKTSRDVTINLYSHSSTQIYDTGHAGSVTCYFHVGSTLDYSFFISSSTQKKLNLFFVGENALAFVKGVCILQENQNASLVIEQNHSASNTESVFLMRSLLADEAVLYQKGNIIVLQKASSVAASQKSKAITLSPNVKVQMLPELDVRNKNVRCLHGAAVGSFDEKQLFYLQSRGVDGKSARQLLAQSFLTADLKKGKGQEEFIEMIHKKVQELL